MIRQPIAMAFDDRNRLWVAECYTYAEARTNFDLNLRDRIVILEDVRRGWAGGQENHLSR